MLRLCSVAAVAAMSIACAVPKCALAQEPPTPGGDVSADEASVLPPVVVQSPNEPVGARARPKRKPQGENAAVPAPGTASESTAQAEGAAGAGNFGVQDYAGPAIGAGVFTLGQLDLIGGSTITSEAMWSFNKQSLDQAVNIIPGVSANNVGGARNERDIFVRGFNRLQVPLSIDGVRMYLPYDNRLDMSRFVTPDLAEVQVAKGYVSVLNGPGGEGGAINLVSRKPVKEIELEGRAGLTLDGNDGGMNAWNAYAYAGTRQKGYYAQVSGTFVDQDHFNLSSDFSPATPATLGYLPTFPYEDGGDRDHSAFQDWRINAKVGITPNATDEYTINYTTQSAEKDSPLHTQRQIVQGYFFGNTPRFWEWPEWDVSTLSWLSKTQLGSASYVKSNAYYNTFDNTLSFFPDATYTNPFTDSPYDDHAYGGFVEVGTDLIPMNTLKAAIHYRHDVHSEQAINYSYTPVYSVSLDAEKRQAEETWSYAVENTFHALPGVDIVTGLSYDTNEVLENGVGGVDAGVEKPEADAWNWQAAAIYSYSATGKAHADVSSRTRFPTLFDRYSTRFGSRLQNPNLAPERATNYEVGLSDFIFPGARLSTAVFYSQIDDSIQNAFAGANGNASIVGFNADGETYGFEISLDWDVTRRLRVGGNYTYMERSLDFAQAALELPSGTAQASRDAVAASELEGTPRHEAFLYLAWKPTDRLTLTPSLELAADRTALVTSCASSLVRNGGGASPPSAQTGNCQKASGFTGKPSYIDIGAYALLNFQAEYAFNEAATMAVGVTNLLDENYSLADGFPEAGRQIYATVRARF